MKQVNKICSEKKERNRSVQLQLRPVNAKTSPGLYYRFMGVKRHELRDATEISQCKK